MIRAAALAAAFVLASAAPAFAHVEAGAHASLAAGFAHPLFGLDHVLAMVAVGLWAWRVGGRALWLGPAAFVAAMGLGFGLALLGAPLPFVEPAILASVVGLGLLALFAARLPALPAAGVVALFAVFHGFAHGGEIAGATPGLYAAGFMAATAGLHGAGLLLGRALSGRRTARA